MSEVSATRPSTEAFSKRDAPVKAARAWPGWVGPVAMLVLIVCGAVLRFWNLGELTYQVDEGYQLTGVKAILANGVPSLDTGHAYVRAPIFLYSEALCAQLFGLSPFSMRLPAALFGVLCIPVAYWFGRSLVDSALIRTSDENATRRQLYLPGAVGWTLAVFFAFSQWHVEFSRYARFYTLLAAVVMLALIAFNHGYLRGRFWGKAAFWLLTAVAITLHDTAVSLGLCFIALLPWRDQSWLRRIGLFVQAGVVGVMWVGYRKLLDGWAKSLSSPDLVLVHTTNTEAQDAAEEAAKKPLSFLPDVKLPGAQNTLDAWDAGVWLLAVPAVIALVGLGWAAIVAARSKRPSQDAWGQVAVAALVVVCAVFHQGALAVLFAAAGLAWWVRGRKDLISPLGVGLFATLLILGFHAAANVKFLSYGYTRGVTRLFAYPDWNRYTLEWLWRGWIMVLIFLPVGLLLLTWKARDKEGRPAGPWLIVGWLLLGMSLGGMAEGQFNEARYFFHLSALIFAAYGLVWVWLGTNVSRVLRMGPRGTAIAVAVCVSGGMFISDDLRPSSAWSVTQRDYTSERNWARGVFNWFPFADFHEDVESVSRYVNESIEEGDRVISVGPPHRATLVDHFAGQVDYIVAPPMIFTLKWEDENGHWHEPVTAAEIVGEPDRLIEIIEEAEAEGVTLWVVSNDRMTLPKTYMLEDDFAALVDRVTPRADHVFRGRDESSFVGVAVLPGVAEAEVSQPEEESMSEPADDSNDETESLSESEPAFDSPPAVEDTSEKVPAEFNPAE